MPILSVYIGESQISALSFTSRTDFKFGFYPYAFPAELLRSGFNEERFYKQVLKHLGETFDMDVSTSELLVGTLAGVHTGLGGNDHISITEALNTIQDYAWILVESFAVVSGDSFASFYPTEKDLTFSQPIYVNHLSNKSLYPQIVPSSPDTFKAEDVLTKKIVATMDPIVATGKPLIFTGGRFTSFKQNPVAIYLLALDLIRNPGLFDVKIDFENKLPAISILNYHLRQNAVDESVENAKETISFLSNDLLNANSDETFDEEFTTLGTVLSAPGGVECLFEMEAGNSQFVELKNNKLFVFPLDKGLSARIVADGKSVGHVEKNVKGGALGFVIDTRDKTEQDFLDNSSTRITEWAKVINERISAF